jgi:DNA polymerase III delta prime subunit
MLDSSLDPLSPKSVGEIVGNTETWENTLKLIKENTASHIVLVGPAGCGKSVFLRLSLSVFPTLIINCMGNSGLRDHRDAIRLFARGSKTKEGNMRWVILEHADSLTADTQAFLRRMLETTSSSTRFVFECRDGGAITEPIYSRSMIVAVNSPDQPEMIYELQRRTQYKLPKQDVDAIVKYSFGNLRHALIQAFAKGYCVESGQGNEIIDSLLLSRPKDKSNVGWIEWSLLAESTCRLEGVDLRDVLRVGWPNNTTVSNTCAQWSRLGGTSPRALFFDCVSNICGKT